MNTWKIIGKSLKPGFAALLEPFWMFSLYLSDPVWHDVGTRCPVVQVEDHHAQNDGESDQDHGEHDVVDNNRDGERRLGDFVGQQQHEDSEGD